MTYIEQHILFICLNHQNKEIMLNKQKGNMYGFVTHTFNVIKGRCPHNCSYCYMKRWGKQSELHFDEKELKTDLGKGNYIFVGSSCDMWAKDIQGEWIQEVLECCINYPDNTYFFQSKNPGRFIDFPNHPPKKLYCSTIETNRVYKNIMGNAPPPYERELLDIDHITIEPIMDFDIDSFVRLILDQQPIQVNIGADSSRNNLPEPPKEKIIELIGILEKHTKVYLKKNLNRLLK